MRSSHSELGVPVHIHPALVNGFTFVAVVLLIVK